MRIIAGKYGGRRLVSFKASHIRPTTDRVKEVLFNKLQGVLEESLVLDLFSGTGNLAIEALSRGAREVHAVEMNRKSLSIIKKNKDLLKIADELKIFSLDVLRFLSTAKQSYDVILVDPPFTEKMADEVMAAIARSQVCHDGTAIYIESSVHEGIEEQYPHLRMHSQKDYGDKKLSEFVYCKEPVG